MEKLVSVLEQCEKYQSEQALGLKLKMPAERPIRPFCGCYLQDCKQLVHAIIVWSIIFKTPDSVLKKPNPNACICTVWEKH